MTASGDTLPLAPQSENAAAPDVCRICLDVSSEALISPCAGCRGSSAVVHYSCVALFYQTRRDWSNLSCPTCKHRYEDIYAEELGKIGLEHSEQEHGRDSEDFADVLISLAGACAGIGKFDQQRQHLEDAVGILERTVGHDHPLVATALTNLGSAFQHCGESQLARDVLERSLSIKEREHGSQGPTVAYTLANLGIVYGSLNDHGRAKDHLERALQIREQACGPDHELVAVTLINLGICCGELGDYQSQRSALERALIIQEREYGTTHLNVATTLANLGWAYGKLGDPSHQNQVWCRSRDILQASTRPQARCYLELLDLWQGDFRAQADA